MSLDDPNFDALIASARAGDATALSNLLIHSEDFAYQTALGILHDPHRAADAAQEALIAVYLGLASLRDDRAFPAWLAGIVRHQCHRILRRRDMEWVPLAGEVELLDSIVPDQRAANNELRAQVLRAIEKLPSAQRHIVQLYYLKGCSQLEVAAFLSLPLTTVNNRLSAARVALRQRISIMTQHTPAPSQAPAQVVENVGLIIDVTLPVITARFDASTPPDIFDALAICDGSGRLLERMKVAHRLDDGVVRCLATGQSDAIKTGMNVLDTRSVGIGLTPFDGVAVVPDGQLTRAIETLAPRPASSPKPLETGIKPLDLFSPLTAGGTFGLFGIQGVGRIVLVEELIRRLADKAESKLNLFYMVHRNEPDSVRDMLTREKGYPGDATAGVNVFWILNDAATDPDIAASNPFFDASAFCTPVLGAQGLYPAIDPLASRSRLITDKLIDPAHSALLTRLRDVLTRAKALMSDPIMLEYIACRAVPSARRRAESFPPQRLAQLTPDDRLLVSRARKVERFLTTPFFVAELFSHRTGHFVPLKETIAGCTAILDGHYDDVPEDRFLYIGEIEQARVAQPPPAVS